MACRRTESISKRWWAAIWGRITIGADVEGITGSTQYGLGTTTFIVGPLFEGDFDRFRIGGGFRLGLLSVDRATTTANMRGSIEGVYLRASVDVLRFNEDHSAVFLAAKGSVDSVGGTLYGGVLGAGVRF